MNEKMAKFLLGLLLLPLTFSFSSETYSPIISVFDHGAIGNGSTDDSQAFRDAWESTCASTGTPTMQIPAGKTFLVYPLTFQGPCKSNNITVQINGNLVAPANVSAWNCHGKNCYGWIGFSELDGLSISGSGTIDGRGSTWWGLPCHKHKHKCKRAPTQADVDGLMDYTHRLWLYIVVPMPKFAALKLRTAPQMHVSIEQSMTVHLSQLYIEAPEDSPNTDGIHIQGSKYVYIYKSRIGTGDDCISIGSGSSQINITTVTCGPGHGISIGSLGKGGETEEVEDVHVKDVQLIGTSNGVRIKTWQGGKGHAKNIVFEQVYLDNVNYPIIIDQYYCDSSHKCPTQISAVHVSNVTYKEVFGTSNTKVAVNLACSDTIGCTDISINNITINSVGNRQTSSYCRNAHGTMIGKVMPMVSCLAYN